MKQHQTCLSLVMALALVASACTGGNESTAPTTPTPVTQTATPTADETPTPVPEQATATDEERIEAAITQLDTEVAGGEGPSDTYAYDLLDTAVDEDGNVTLTICAWTGDTVFDTVRDSLYRTNVDADGTITASHITTPIATGECLNTQLIESALDFIDEFEAYWADISASPESFSTDPRTSELLTDSYLERSTEIVDGFIEDDIYFESSVASNDVRAELATDALFRRYRFEELRILELVTCRPMNPEYGAYRDELLVDDGRSESSPGVQAIHAYQLVLDTDRLGIWQLSGTDALGWADCFETGDWPAAANIWRPRDTILTALDR